MCHVFYNRFQLRFFFFTCMCHASLFMSTPHVMYLLFLYMFVKSIFVSFHVCAMFLTIIPAANADFLPNFFKINCHIGIDAIEETLSKKRREKLNQSSLLNKNMYQSSVIHLHHFFLIYIFQGLSNSKCAMKCRLYKDRDLRCARIA